MRIMSWFAAWTMIICISNATAQTPDAQEPNDTAGTATVAPFGGSVDTQFFQDGDVDYFSFTAGPGLVKLRLTGRAAAGATMVLSKLDGTEIATSGNWLVADLPSSATYHVRVTYDEPFVDTFNTYQFSVGSFTATRTVADDGTGDHLTIGAAITAAAANDVILVQPGTYDEAPVIDKNLSLIGANARTVFIGRDVLIKADVIFQGFGMNNPVLSDIYGILIEINHTVSILNNIIEDMDGIGVSYQHGNTTVSGNVIRRVGRNLDLFGIEAQHNTVSDISYNLLDDNGQAGVWLLTVPSSVVVRENIIRNNKFNGVNTGKESRAEIRDNLIEGNSIGIRGVDSGTNSLYVNNTIRNNGTGIRFEVRTNGEVRGNIIEDNITWGVLATDGVTHVVLRENEIRRNGIGVEVRADAVARLYDNVIENNSGDGILVTTLGITEIVRNQIRNNQHNGIHGNSRALLLDQFRENTIEGNGLNGIYITDEGSRATIRNNHILDNIGDGILVEKNATAEIDSNSFTDMDTTTFTFRVTSAVSVLNDGFATITNNTFRDGYRQSVRVSDAGADIINNDVRGYPEISKKGILLLNVSFAQIRDNMIEQAIIGIHLQETQPKTGISSHATIQNNTILNSVERGIEIAIQSNSVAIIDNIIEGKYSDEEYGHGIFYKVDGVVPFPYTGVFSATIQNNQIIGMDTGMYYQFKAGDEFATSANFPTPDVLSVNTFLNIAVSNLTVGGSAALPLLDDTDTGMSPVRPYLEWTDYGTVQGLGTVQTKTSSIREVDRNRINNERLVSTTSEDLWAATDAGVSRFDPDTGTWINYTTIQGLGSNTINGLLESAGGDLWAATSGGASRFDPVSDNWTSYGLSAGLGSDMVNSLMETVSGDIWAATDGGASKFNGSTWTNYTTSDGLGSLTVNSLIEIASGDIWAATVGGASKFNGTTWTNYSADTTFFAWEVGNQVKDLSFFAFLESRDGSLYGLTDRRVHRFDGIEWQPVVQGVPITNLFDNVNNRIRNLRVYSIAETPNGFLWIGTDSGVRRYDPATGQIITFYQAQSPDGVPFNLDGSVEYLSSGLWVATFNGYVCHFDPHDGSWVSFQLGNDAVTGTDRTVIGLTDNGAGGLWAMTEGVGVSYLGEPQLVGFVTDDADNRLTDTMKLIITDTGKYWLAFTDFPVSQLSVFNEVTDEWMQEFAPDTQTYDMIEDKDGSLWMTTINRYPINGVPANVVRYDPSTGATQIYGIADGFFSIVNGGFINYLTVDSNGAVWTAGHIGVNRYNAITDDWTGFDALTLLGGNPTSRVVEDGEGGIWVATKEGIHRFDSVTETWTSFPVPDEVGSLTPMPAFVFNPYALTNTAVVDDDGTIWVGAGNGLHGYTPQSGQWTSLTTSPRNVVTISDSPEDLTSGLIKNELTTLTKDDKGYIWTGTSVGINRYNPKTGSIRSFTGVDGLPSPSISAIVQTATGRLWAGTTTGEIAHFDRDTERWIAITGSDVQTAGAVIDISETPEGEVWMTRPNGVTRLSGPDDSNPPLFEVSLTGVDGILVPSASVGFDINIVDPFTLKKTLEFTHTVVADGQPVPEPDWSKFTSTAAGVAANLADKDYVLHVWARDEVGSVNRRSLSFTIDTAAPVTLITSPGQDQIISGRFPIQGAVTDRSGLDSGSRVAVPDLANYTLEYRRTGTEAWTELTTVDNPTNLIGTLFDWDLGNLTGAYELRLRAVDALAHTNVTTVSFQVVTSRLQVRRDRTADLEDSDQKVALTMPPGALTADTLVTISRLNDDQVPVLTKPSVRTLVSDVYTMSPDGLALQKPATLSFQVPQATLDGAAAGEYPAVFRHTGAEWTLIGGTLDKSAAIPRVQAAVKQLGTYAVLLTDEAGGGAPLADMNCQPRMISPRGGGFNTRMAISFTLGQSADVTVRVFDMAGHMIREIIAGQSRSPGSQVEVWDGKDQDGRIVYDGMYLVRVEAGSEAANKVVSVVNGQQ